jgi:hypothetical protein
MDNARCEASITSLTKKEEYLKDQINEMETNSKKKNIRLVHESNVTLIDKKADKMNNSNYQVISLLPTTYKILSSVLLSR